MEPRTLIILELRVFDQRIEVEAWKNGHDHLLSFGHQLDEKIKPSERSFKSILSNILDRIDPNIK